MIVSQEVAIRLLSTGIRVFYLCGLCMLYAAIVTCLVLGRRRKIGPFVAAVTGKLLIHNVLFSVILAEFFADQFWYQLSYGILVLFTTFGAYGIHYYTFNGSPGKIVTGLWFGEICGSSIVMLSMGCINYLEKREQLFSFLGEFHAMDLLIFPLSTIVFGAFYYLAAPLLKRFRRMEVKHLLIPVLLCGFSATSVFSDMEKGIYVYVIVLMTAMVLVFIAVTAVRKIQKRMRLDHEYLRLKQELMSRHYTAILMQIQKMEYNQILIEKQMQKLKEKPSISENNEKTAEYLRQLKSEYTQLRTGIYCNDWMVDAILCDRTGKLEALGIKVECLLQEYDRGRIEEQDIVRILLVLFEYAAESRKENIKHTASFMRLRMAAVGNQLLILCTFHCERKPQGIHRRILPYLKKYGGTDRVSWKDRLAEVEISICKKGANQ